MLVSRKARDMGFISAIVLLGALSFGLGRLSAREHTTVPVALCDTAPSVLGVTATALPATTQPPASTTQVSVTGTYVASKSGSAYHYPWCSGAQRIKEENKIWFATKEDAEAAGYRPAGNCKGL